MAGVGMDPKLTVEEMEIKPPRVALDAGFR